jgi:hypothetical protein
MGMYLVWLFAVLAFLLLVWIMEKLRGGDDRHDE